MKAKKVLALSLSLLTLGSVSGGLGGCFGGGTTQGVIDSDKVINIMPLSKGYGIGWLQEVGEAFNKLYKDEGYEVNIWTADPITRAERRLRKCVWAR